MWLSRMNAITFRPVSCSKALTSGSRIVPETSFAT
jgi:hypothetical protein